MKQKIRAIVDIVTLISFIITAITAFMGRGAREAHEISGKIMIVFAIIHFLLNFKMFTALFKSAFQKQNQ